MDFLKKSVIVPGVSKLPSLSENYIMEGVRSPSPKISNCLTEAVVRRCSLKKVSLKISKHSQENICARFSFLKLQALGLQFY